MASKLRKFITWFRDSLTPPQVLRAEKARRDAAADNSVRTRSASPHYYAFLYRKEQISNGRVLSAKESGWESPKQYFGPFDTQAEARAAVQDEITQYGLPRRQYKIQRLTAKQFEQLWGTPPGGR